MLERSRGSSDVGRIDSLPVPLLALLIETGVHPAKIGVETVSASVLTTWESDAPVTRDVAPRVHIDRGELERELLRLVERHPDIDLVPELPAEPVTDLRIDATGRRATSATHIVEPEHPWIARTFLFRGSFGAAQQSLRLAPFDRGYFYRLASPRIATVGLVTPDAALLKSRDLDALVIAERCQWILAGLGSLCSGLPGRGGKTSVQRSVGRSGWTLIGDAAFASDSLSSQGLANGISAAMKLVSPSDRPASEAYHAHLANTNDVIERSRFARAPAWREYLAFLHEELRSAAPPLQ